MTPKALPLLAILTALTGCSGMDTAVFDDPAQDSRIGLFVERPAASVGTIHAGIPNGFDANHYAGAKVAYATPPWGLEASRSWSRTTDLVPVGAWSATDEFWFCWWLLDAYSIHRQNLSNPLELPSRDPSALFAAMGSERFTYYVTPDSAATFLAGISGAAPDSVLGIRFSPFWEDTLVVGELAADGVAKEKGVRRKDRILAVNGLSAFPADSALARLRSLPRASDIVLTVLHPEGDTASLCMRPRTARFASVWFDTLPGGNGYLRIDQFVSDAGYETGKQVKAAMQALSGAVANGWLILDLRSNPGGEIENSLAAAGAFLDKGDTLISMSSMDLDENLLQGRMSDRWPLGEGGLLPAGTRLAILANAGTASASEIMISALRENLATDRWKLIGSRTYGKGIGQVILKTPAGGIARITSLDIAPVHDSSYHLKGIAPTDSVASGTELAYATSLFSHPAIGARRVLSGAAIPGLDQELGSVSAPGAWVRLPVPLRDRK